MDISLLGIPLEAGNSVPGTLMGPAALRTAGIAAMLTGLGHEVRDYGDVVAAAPADLSGQLPTCRNPGEIKAWTEAIHDRGLDVLRAGGVPIFMGGDHALSMGTVAAVSRHCRETGRDLAVLWLDAHADFNTPDTTPSGNMHGMTLAALLGEDNMEMAINKPDEDTVEYWNNLKNMGGICPKIEYSDLVYVGLRDFEV
ncbi:MAG: arginase family protein, partial [Devosia nanyangense]|nr:arginase family protein [Devosia nanyangense]